MPRGGHLERCASIARHPRRPHADRPRLPRLFRATELEYRIACDGAGIPYAPMPIRDGLLALADFYERRLAALDDPDLLLEDDTRAAAKRPVRAALDEVRRRLAIEPVRDA